MRRECHEVAHHFLLAIQVRLSHVVSVTPLRCLVNSLVHLLALEPHRGDGDTGDPVPLHIALASTVAKTTRIRSIDSSASLLILFVVVAICHLLCLEHLGVPPEALSSLLSLMPWCLSSADSEGSKAGTMTRCTCEPTGECPGSHDLVLLGRLESRP